MLRDVSTSARLLRSLDFCRKWPLSIALRREQALKYQGRNKFKPLPSIYSTSFSQIAFFHTSSRQMQDFGDDTIYALSTAPGRAGIAIVRISGPACLKIYNDICPTRPLPKPRYASLRTLLDPSNPSNVLDSDALVLYFPGPKTVTGEDVLELHIHGGSATVKAVLSAISKCSSNSSVRYAEPGEFTRRAFQNERLDLAQVEALSDTLSAETEQQRRVAVRANSGVLGRTYDSWREQLLYARGELEALIDFSEDQHFDESPAELLSNVTAQIAVMLDSITSHEAASRRGELLKKGIRISLLGPPNAGKSSLLNQIVGREASIVSQEAGTTRDVVEVSLDIGGYLCTFADTAGLRTSSNLSTSQSIIGAVEQEGIKRAKAKASESDLVIALASIEPSSSPLGFRINHSSSSLALASAAPSSLVVINKCDAVTPAVLAQLLIEFRSATSQWYDLSVGHSTALIFISCRDARERLTNQDPGNINGFTTALVRLFEEMTMLPTELEDLLGVTERQRQLLASCSEDLKAFLEEAGHEKMDGECDIVVAAEYLRAAANCLSRITGRGEAGDVEEILGVVFEKFCVGK